MIRGSRLSRETGDASSSPEPWRSDVAVPAMDPFLVAMPLLGSLLTLQLGAVGAALVLFSAFPIAWLRWQRLGNTINHGWPVLLLGFFTLASIFWSIDPGATARYGLQYFLTIVPAVLLATLLSRHSLLTGLFWSFAIYNAAALAFGRYVPLGVSDIAFAGIAGSKNMAAQVAGIGALIGLAMVGRSIVERQFFALVSAIASILISCVLLLLAKSTGAIVGTGIASLVIVALIVSSAFQSSTRNLFLIILATIIVATIASYSLWFNLLFAEIVDATGKEPGLTGRDVLWERADLLIAKKPFLGIGYGAFWVPGNLEAEGLWRYFGIETKTGFHFHNTPREILVSLGYCGLFMFIAVSVAALLALIWRTVQRPDATRVLFIGIAVFNMLLINFELVGFSPIYFGTILAAITLTLGFAPDRIDHRFNDAGLR
ncbi:O-antigen ligase family protein [Croceicoccus marinus]|uniref:O-antigen ligase family protein n=1 Tax=Croceicoccus marinus TaxID=450378 RepID=A0A7G6VT16_9SPHN|nr:O-antigen ligase family protein [Croceicoccus marinus]QNE04881.1 O-antigen ligase family protein [Croceicoccus marinus]